MDFWTTVRVLLRRWQVAIPVFAASLGLAAAVYVSVHTDYESTGTIVLTSPTEGARVPATNNPAANNAPRDRVNPLLAFDGSLVTSAQIVIQKLQDPAINEELLGEGALTSYEVGDGQLSGPFIMVVSLARSPEEARTTVTRVLDRARAELVQSQEALKAPASTFITPVQVVAPTPRRPRPAARSGSPRWRWRSGSSPASPRPTQLRASWNHAGDVTATRTTKTTAKPG